MSKSLSAATVEKLNISKAAQNNDEILCIVHCVIVDSAHLTLDHNGVEWKVLSSDLLT